MHQILQLESIESTQKLAKEIIKEGKSENGLVIIAQKQQNGIGRLNRKWESPLGGLWMTSIYQQEFPLALIEGFSVKLGLVICEVLEKIFPIQLQIKWPNDIILNNKKVGGVLIETLSRDEYLTHLIIGIGLNANNKVSLFSKELAPFATSLCEVIGKEVNLNKLRDNILTSQYQLFLDTITNQSTDIYKKWSTKSFTYNKEIIIQSMNETITGIESGITEKSCLKVKLSDDSIKVIDMGEIIQIRKRGL